MEYHFKDCYGRHSSWARYEDFYSCKMDAKMGDLFTIAITALKSKMCLFKAIV